MEMAAWVQVCATSIAIIGPLILVERQRRIERRKDQDDTVKKLIICANLGKSVIDNSRELWEVPGIVTQYLMREKPYLWHIEMMASGERIMKIPLDKLPPDCIRPLAYIESIFRQYSKKMKLISDINDEIDEKLMAGPGNRPSYVAPAAAAIHKKRKDIIDSREKALSGCQDAISKIEASIS